MLLRSLASLVFLLVKGVIRSYMKLSLHCVTLRSQRTYASSLLRFTRISPRQRSYKELHGVIAPLRYAKELEDVCFFAPSRMLLRFLASLVFAKCGHLFNLLWRAPSALVLTLWHTGSCVYFRAKVGNLRRLPTCRKLKNAKPQGI